MELNFLQGANISHKTSFMTLLTWKLHVHRCKLKDFTAFSFFTCMCVSTGGLLHRVLPLPAALYHLPPRGDPAGGVGGTEVLPHPGHQDDRQT